MNEAIIDTDILSEISKRKNQNVLAAANEYLASHPRFAFSAITFYEVLRGLIAKRANHQLARFVKIANSSDVLPVTIAVLERAANLWAEAQRHGHPRDDADLIIAATALESGRELVTGNIQHFSWINGLRLTDWRSPRP